MQVDPYPALPSEALLRLGSALTQAGYRFTTVSPATHERVNRRPGNDQAKDLAGVFGWNRVFSPDILPKDIRKLIIEADVCQPCGDLFQSNVRFSTLDNLLYMHSSFPTIDNDSVFFGPDTYRYARALNDLFATGKPFQRIVDIGCGAGSGAILATKANPSAEVFAVDINSRALDYTRVNARMAGVELSVVHSDLLNGLDGDFDLIVANPPFIMDPLGRSYRHGGGLFGSEFSLRIVETALHRLSPGGTLLLYTGLAYLANESPFVETVENLLGRERFRWNLSEMDPDIFGEELECTPYMDVDRIAATVLKVTRESEIF